MPPPPPCSAALWNIPQVPCGGGGSLPRPGAPFDAHPGSLEDEGLGLPRPPRSSWGGVVGVVSAGNRVRTQFLYYTGFMKSLSLSLSLSLFLTSSDAEWPGLVDAMSGLLGAHLNAIDSASSFRPLLSFRPSGAVLSMWTHAISVFLWT